MGPHPCVESSDGARRPIFCVRGSPLLWGLAFTAHHIPYTIYHIPCKYNIPYTIHVQQTRKGGSPLLLGLGFTEQRETERDRERQGERQRERQRQIERDREREKDRERGREGRRER